MTHKLFTTLLICLTTSLSGQEKPAPILNMKNMSIRKADVTASAVIGRLPTLTRNEVLVPMDLGTLKPETLEVLIDTGSTRRVATSNLKVSAGVANLLVGRNEQVIVRPKTGVETRAFSAELVEFPGLLIKGHTADSGGDLQALTYTLFLKPREAPLPWNSQLDAYATKLVVGFDLENKNASINLNPPVTVEFFPSNVKVSPARVTISRTGTSGFKEVDLSSILRADTLVTARSDLGELSCPVEVVARIGALLISSSPRIPGFGLGTSELTCTLLAEDGKPFSDKEPLLVHLTATRGMFSPNADLEIPAGTSSASIQLRSSGLGPVRITASAQGIENFVEIDYFFPMGLILAAILGGCLGGCGRVFKQKLRSSRKQRKLIIEGCVVGVLTVAVAMSGVAISGLSMPAQGTELGVFVLAGLSGFYGIPVLDWLAKTVLPEVSKAEDKATNSK